MPRYKKARLVSGYPRIKSFSPKGVLDTGNIILTVEGLEAIRLSDFEKLDQTTASKIMDVSRQTYGRILSEARAIIAEALVTGKTINVSGGSYEMRGTRGNGCGLRRRCTRVKH